MTTNVCILDYGSGNVRSVYNMMSQIVSQVTISNAAQDVRSATHLILPGVGAFGASMEKIQKKLPLKELKEEIFTKKKPFLGICVGMQVLAETGHEFGEHKVLGWIEGTVRKLNSGNLPLPHMGWNEVTIQKQSPILKRFPHNPDFYFVHSYVFEVKHDKDIVGTTLYHENFCSVLFRGNIFGVQFHPEKSQKVGKILLENFIHI